MRRTIIIIAGVIIVIIVGTLFFFFGTSKPGQGNAGPGEVNAPTGSAAELGATLSSAMPADAPKGDTVMIQGSHGVISLKNFYKTAVGYWKEGDAIALARGSAWTVWYYRASGNFEVRLSPKATDADQKGGEAALVAALGVNQTTACGLPAAVGIPVDGGAAYETGQMSFCSGVAF